MVIDDVYRTSSTIALFVNKNFLSRHLFNEDGKGIVELIKGAKLNQTLLKFTLICSLGICNLIASLEHHPNNMGSLDYIFKLKALFGYNYNQDNCFPGQQARHKVYLFKMFVDGITSRFDLVRQM